MRALKGKAFFSIPDGQLDAMLAELAGFDGGETLLLRLGKKQTVNLSCAYISARVQSGMLEITTALIDTTDTKFTMDGTADLGQKGIDLQLLTHPKDASLFATRAPPVLEATFKNPEFHPSWSSLLSLGATASAFGAVAPPAALLAFVEPGLDKDSTPSQTSSPH